MRKAALLLYCSTVLLLLAAASPAAAQAQVNILQYFRPGGGPQNPISSGEVFWSEPSAGGFTIFKNAARANYEKFFVRGNYIYHGEDTTWATAAGDVRCTDPAHAGREAAFTLLSEKYSDALAACQSHRNQEGAKWVPVSMSVDGSTGPLPRTVVGIDEATKVCCAAPYTGPADHTMKFEYQGCIAFPTGVYSEDAIELAILSGPGAGEHFFYDIGAGWVGFHRGSGGSGAYITSPTTSTLHTYTNTTQLPGGCKLVTISPGGSVGAPPPLNDCTNPLSGPQSFACAEPKEISKTHTWTSGCTLEADKEIEVPFGAGVEDQIFADSLTVPIEGDLDFLLGKFSAPVDLKTLMITSAKDLEDAGFEFGPLIPLTNPNKVDSLARMVPAYLGNAGEGAVNFFSCNLGVDPIRTGTPDVWGLRRTLEDADLFTGLYNYIVARPSSSGSSGLPLAAPHSLRFGKSGGGAEVKLATAKSNESGVVLANAVTVSTFNLSLTPQSFGGNSWKIRTYIKVDQPEGCGAMCDYQIEATYTVTRTNGSTESAGGCDFNDSVKGCLIWGVPVDTLHWGAQNCEPQTVTMNTGDTYTVDISITESNAPDNCPHPDYPSSCCRKTGGDYCSATKTDTGWNISCGAAGVPYVCNVGGCPDANTFPPALPACLLNTTQVKGTMRVTVDETAAGVCQGTPNCGACTGDLCDDYDDNEGGCRGFGCSWDGATRDCYGKSCGGYDQTECARHIPVCNWFSSGAGSGGVPCTTTVTDKIKPDVTTSFLGEYVSRALAVYKNLIPPNTPVDEDYGVGWLNWKYGDDLGGAHPAVRGNFPSKVVYPDLGTLQNYEDLLKRFLKKPRPSASP